jgi:hypothetical protein
LALIIYCLHLFIRLVWHINVTLYFCCIYNSINFRRASFGVLFL